MKRKLKGFTLTELIVVIAIIGILTAIFVPSWMSWIAKSKVRKQNNNARVIFNAAQTVVQDYKFRERKLEDSKKNIGTGEFCFYWDKDTGASASRDITKVDDGSFHSEAASAFVDSFANQVNRIYGDEEATTYRIYVKNYMVESVVASSGNNNRHKGSYPVKQDGTSGTSVQSFDMTGIVYIPETSEPTT